MSYVSQYLCNFSSTPVDGVDGITASITSRVGDLMLGVEGSFSAIGDPRPEDVLIAPNAVIYEVITSQAQHEVLAADANLVQMFDPEQVDVEPEGL